MKWFAVAVAITLVTSASGECDGLEQARFDIAMCQSHMCNNCRLAWCIEQCQSFQEDFPECRCAHWNEGRDSYSGGDHANQGKYGDVGDYSFPVDNIVCPVLASAIEQRRMKLDAARMVPRSELANFMLELGSQFFADAVLDPANVNVDPLDIFNMNNHKDLEHGHSSGIRDPLPKNRTYMDELLSFANDNGEFTATELAAAGKHFQSPEHQAKLIGDHKVLADFRTVDAVFVSLMLPVLGRCGPTVKQIFNGILGTIEGNHYPKEDCSNKDLYMRSDDLENLFWENRFPDDFAFFPVDSSPE